MNQYLNSNQSPQAQHQTLVAAPVKPYTKTQLRHLYNIPEKSLDAWLAEFKDDIGIRHGRFYSVAQVEIIFSKFGAPLVSK